MTTYAVVYRDSAGEWRWQLRDKGNHEVIADSGEGYHNRADAEHGLELATAPPETVEVKE